MARSGTLFISSFNLQAIYDCKSLKPISRMIWEKIKKLQVIVTRLPTQIIIKEIVRQVNQEEKGENAFFSYLINHSRLHSRISHS